jgi:hypothetical protein
VALKKRRVGAAMGRSRSKMVDETARKTSSIDAGNHEGRK